MFASDNGHELGYDIGGKGAYSKMNYKEGRSVFVTQNSKKLDAPSGKDP